MNQRNPSQRSQVRDAGRHRVTLTAAAVIAALALVVGLGLLSGNAAHDDPAGSPAAPRGTVGGYAVPRGHVSAPVLVTVYEDFQCPACRIVEGYLHAPLQSYLRRAVVRVEYRPMAFLDDASTTAYSSRALGAAACALDQSGAAVFARMHDLLFARQPAEGTAGLDNVTLADTARLAGADRARVSSCIEAEPFAGWVRAATDQAMRAGVTATPTILVEGSPLRFTSQEHPAVTFRRAVEAVLRR